MIVSTDPYIHDEFLKILSVRCEEEDVEMADDALELLARIGTETSLRYASQMVITASLAAQRRGRVLRWKSKISNVCTSCLWM